MPLHPDEMVDAFEASVNEHTRRALQVSAELEAAAATVRSDGGEVTVRVDSAGGLADLRFHPEADRLSRDELARLVLTTSRRAQARLAEQVGAIVSGVYGEGSATASFVADAYASRYAVPDDGEEQR
ncbi:YbaB/EbfC family nucleoid-associated protein [Actinoplanes sp. NPDC049596]|uniref:YbaB/EbfC family nucleoid-associated protein n=1 Tax=unclassified Actinoplanes TaxID=2626549 RepID=UPI003425E244